jgi:hypothetical protein
MPEHPNDVDTVLEFFRLQQRGLDLGVPIVAEQGYGFKITLGLGLGHEYCASLDEVNGFLNGFEAGQRRIDARRTAEAEKA